jgi:hypothetical protein
MQELRFIVAINTVLLPLLYLKKIQIKKNFKGGILKELKARDLVCIQEPIL